MTSASVTIAFGIHVDSHSDPRYQARPRAFHFFRFRSMPSTLRTTRVPTRRGQPQKMALAALQTRIAS